MSKIDVESFRKRLLDEKQRLTDDRRRLMDHGGEGMADRVGEMAQFDINHPGEMGTETYEREKDMALNANIDGLLAQVDEAIAKMDAGTYGTCDRCGKTITPARLEAVPYATLCIDCQARVENQ